MWGAWYQATDLRGDPALSGQGTYEHCAAHPKPHVRKIIHAATTKTEPAREFRTGDANLRLPCWVSMAVRIPRFFPRQLMFLFASQRIEQASCLGSTLDRIAPASARLEPRLLWEISSTVQWTAVCAGLVERCQLLQCLSIGIEQFQIVYSGRYRWLMVGSNGVVEAHDTYIRATADDDQQSKHGCDCRTQMHVASKQKMQTQPLHQSGCFRFSGFAQTNGHPRIEIRTRFGRFPTIEQLHGRLQFLQLSGTTRAFLHMLHRLGGNTSRIENHIGQICLELFTFHDSSLLSLILSKLFQLLSQRLVGAKQQRLSRRLA